MNIYYYIKISKCNIAFIIVFHKKLFNFRIENESEREKIVPENKNSTYIHVVPKTSPVSIKNDIKELPCYVGYDISCNDTILLIIPKRSQ